MSSGIFNPQNRFWQTLDHFADLLILSLLWLVCSLPLVTAGAACAALYDAVARCVRGAEPLPWKRFWQTFRRELPCAAAVTVAWGALLWLLAWALRLIGAAAAAPISRSAQASSQSSAPQATVTAAAQGSSRRKVCQKRFQGRGSAPRTQRATAS